MQEAEGEIKKMIDRLSARRMRGKNGDEVRTNRKVQCTSCAWSNVFQMMESKIRKYFCHNVIVVVIVVVVVVAVVVAAAVVVLVVEAAAAVVVVVVVAAAVVVVAAVAAVAVVVVVVAVVVVAVVVVVTIIVVVKIIMLIFQNISSLSCKCNFFSLCNIPYSVTAPQYRGFTIRLRHTTVGRTPLDK